VTPVPKKIVLCHKTITCRVAVEKSGVSISCLFFIFQKNKMNCNTKIPLLKRTMNLIQTQSNKRKAIFLYKKSFQNIVSIPYLYFPHRLIFSVCRLFKLSKRDMVQLDVITSISFIAYKYKRVCKVFN